MQEFAQNPRRSHTRIRASICTRIRAWNPATCLSSFVSQPACPAWSVYVPVSVYVYCLCMWMWMCMCISKCMCLCMCMCMCMWVCVCGCGSSCGCSCGCGCGCSCSCSCSCRSPCLPRLLPQPLPLRSSCARWACCAMRGLAFRKHLGRYC